MPSHCNKASGVNQQEALLECSVYISYIVCCLTAHLLEHACNMLTLSLLDSKWKELNQVTSERQQKLEESSNYLTQFQTAEAQLKHWLVEKELMVSVLGPLSIDPNMLNTQKQQVQVSKDCQHALMIWFLLLMVGLCIVCCCFFLLLAKQYLAFRVSTDQVIGAMLFISKYQPKVLLATAIRRKNYHENEERSEQLKEKMVRTYP